MADNNRSDTPDKPDLKLTPPARPLHDTADPGAHELGDTSDSDDHFSDAQSGPPSSASPIPRTRVEKVSDEPSYGEVPGTAAYRLRVGDAEPDEIAVIPDALEKEKQRVRAASIIRPTTPGGRPIPKTVLEEADDGSGEEQSHPPVTRHRADSRPDIIVKRDGSIERGESSGAGGNETYSTPTPLSPPAPKSPDSGRASSPVEGKTLFSSRSPPPFSALSEDGFSATGSNAGDDEDGFGDDDGGFGNNDGSDNGDAFGDDFADFEEGGQDADFDDLPGGFGGGFSGGFEDAPVVEEQPSPAPPPPAPPAQASVAVIPSPDLDNIDSDEVISITDPYISALFPFTGVEAPTLPPLPRDASVFLSSRSASLWSQLVAPPPLQPPDWIRSRIRRAFLVSLGVPVDLDEILPASKQKKLVLPSVGTPRGSFESRSAARLKNSEANLSSTSVDSHGKPKESFTGSRKKKGPVEPKLDLVRAKQLCMTTKAALDNMTDQELHQHVNKLESMRTVADEALNYWTKKTDEKIGDREAFEGVIENLVKHARKVRK